MTKVERPHVEPAIVAVLDHSRLARVLKRLTIILVISVVTIGGWMLRDIITFDYLVAKETELRQAQIDQPLLVVTVALAVYIAVAGLSFPGAAVLTLAYGWYFGFWLGLMIVSLASTAGATLAMLLSRYLLRDWVEQKMAARLGPINDAFEREGAYYLFTLRLIPVIPFFVINSVMGLTRISARTFWWVSQLGMLPGTAAYVYAGSSVPSLQSLADDGIGKVITWNLLFAFMILGILPLVIKKVSSQITIHKYLR